MKLTGMNCRDLSANFRFSGISRAMPLARWDEDASSDSSAGAKPPQKLTWRYDASASSECEKLVYQQFPTDTHIDRDSAVSSRKKNKK